MPKREVKPTDVIFPALGAVWFVDDSRDVSHGEKRPPLTAEVAKEILGWETEEPDGPKFGDEYLIIDRYKRKVRCKYNVRNRPIYPSVYESYIQDMLNGYWQLNGEAIIRGKTGIDLNGQHQLVAIVLAQQDVDRDPDKWADKWPDGIVKIEKLLIFGIEETDEVVNTMDTCRPRNLADVIYRCPFFAKLPDKTRSRASIVLQYAVKELWFRTGMYLDNFSPRRTHAEAIDFVEHHKRVLDCVRHVVEANVRPDVEDEEEPHGVIGDYIPLGYCAAMMYLMATSATPGDGVQTYYAREDRSEKGLDFSRFDLAAEFWSKLGNDESLAAVRQALADLDDPDNRFGVNLKEKDAVICKAWERFAAGKKIDRRSLVIEHTRNDSGVSVIVDPPKIDGIDLGTVKINPRENPVSDEIEEIEGRKEEVTNGKHEKEAKKTNGGVTPNKPIDEQLNALKKGDYKGITVMFSKSPKSHQWQVWGDDAKIVGDVISKTPKMHPQGVQALSVKDDEIEEVIERVVNLGHSVGQAVQVDSQWQMYTAHRPAANPKRRK